MVAEVTKKISHQEVALQLQALWDRGFNIILFAHLS